MTASASLTTDLQKQVLILEDEDLFLQVGGQRGGGGHERAPSVAGVRAAPALIQSVSRRRN